MRNRYTHQIIEFLACATFILLPLFLFPTVQPMVSKGALNSPLTGVLITHTLLALFYYFNFYYLIPRFYFTGHTVQYRIILVSFLTALILLLQIDPRFNPFPSPPFKYAQLTFIFSIIVRFIVVMLFSFGIANIQRLKLAESEKIRSELSYLKAQINPHFLFNTLNSIYALTVKKSESAPEAVTKLSSIMRHVMSEAGNDLVSLEKEINYINSYIELERLRLTSKVNLSYTVEGDLHRKNISPMIFMPLIENAFKHGVSTKENSIIAIRIQLVKNILNLNISNTCVKNENKIKNGLGLENVKRRLALLYGGKHELSIQEKENIFSVNLVMVLND